MKKSAIFVMLCLAVVLMTGMARAETMLSDFEDNTLDGWQNYAGNPMVVVAAPLPGMGALSMQATINNQYWGQEVMQSWANPALVVANVNAGSSIDFDLVFPSAGYTMTYADIKLEVQNQGGILGNQTTGDMLHNLSNIAKDTLIHVSFDLTPYLPMDPTSTGMNLVFYINPGWTPDTYVPQTVYVDNVKIASVPEPATLVLLAMSSLMALLYWRKR
jgi:hypothetical protein